MFSSSTTKEDYKAERDSTVMYVCISSIKFCDFSTMPTATGVSGNEFTEFGNRR